MISEHKLEIRVWVKHPKEVSVCEVKKLVESATVEVTFDADDDTTELEVIEAEMIIPVTFEDADRLAES